MHFIKCVGVQDQYRVDFLQNKFSLFPETGDESLPPVSLSMSSPEWKSDSDNPTSMPFHPHDFTIHIHGERHHRQCLQILLNHFQRPGLFVLTFLPGTKHANRLEIPPVQVIMINQCLRTPGRQRRTPHPILPGLSVHSETAAEKTTMTISNIGIRLSGANNSSRATIHR